MDSLLSDDTKTHEGHLADWSSFCVAYQETIVRVLRLLGVPEGEVDDLAQSFLLKAAEKNFLQSYGAFQDKEAREGRTARFRTYLYRSIQHHVYDFHRKKKGRVAAAIGLGPEASQSFESEPESTLDPDALYALDVLHQAVQALRRHCERTGKPQFWVFFEETFLANEFRGRRGKTRDELLAAYPNLTKQQLDNGLTTAKRAFRRFVEEVMPRGLRDEDRPGERFDEWMEILRDSNASQFNLLHLAYRVMPFLAPDMSQTGSTALVVQSRPDGVGTSNYVEPALVLDDDELGILLGFRLELPLTEMLDAAELTRYIPPSSSLWALPWGDTRAKMGTGRRSPSGRPRRPVCLLTLIDPTPAEAEALAKADLLGLLERLKSLAKQLRHRTDHTVPEVFAQLLYTLVNVLAIVKCGVDLHTIGPAPLAKNVRWFLHQPWLDDRIRPLLAIGLDFLEKSKAADDQVTPS
jgi:DNA-directed RNA polymerase specialized sigma24 family protein